MARVDTRTVGSDAERLATEFLERQQIRPVVDDVRWQGVVIAVARQNEYGAAIEICLPNICRRRAKAGCKGVNLTVVTESIESTADDDRESHIHASSSSCGRSLP